MLRFETACNKVGHLLAFLLMFPCSIHDNIFAFPITGAEALDSVDDDDTVFHEKQIEGFEIFKTMANTVAAFWNIANNEGLVVLVIFPPVMSVATICF
mmetsp:Transcript_38046/g.55829  ORF Transcript_38046/g.55829 Transcript_38046/m.55829 type:complete len:98 (+) Transcript_38046:1782-2075(+)